MTVYSEIGYKEYDLIIAAVYHKLETISEVEKDEILFEYFRYEYEKISIFKEIVDRMIAEFHEDGFETIAKEASCTEQEKELMIYMDSLKTFKENHNWIVDDIFDQATENLPYDEFEEYYDDYQGYSCTYSNDAVNTFLKHFPLTELPHFDSYYQGLYDSIEEFYEEMEQMKRDDPDCDYNKEDYVMHDEHVFDKNPIKAGPYI